MRTATLLSLRNQARQRADFENTTFVSDAELTEYVNASISELQDLLVSKFGNDYYFSTTTITTDGTNSAYSLPSDFYKLLGVDLIINNAEYITLKPYMPSERNQYRTSLARAAFGGTNLRYHLQGQNINFIPLPNANQSIQLLYVPTLAKLVNNGDVLDGVNGWEEYVVIDAAIKMRIKEESSIQELMAEKAALIERITTAAENRDAGQNFRVTDVTGEGYADTLFDF